MELQDLKTRFIGKDIMYFKTIDSTQTFAKNASKEKIKNGTVILADMQTAGVGTNDRKWFTGKEQNLTMTIILYPNCNIEKISNLTVLIAECMVKSIKKLYGYDLEIKKPNDIVYNNKKLAGILTESRVEGEVVKKVCIGIGFNLNQTNFPEELKAIASSLKIEFGKDFLREEIMKEFFFIFEKEYLKIIKEQ